MINVQYIGNKPLKTDNVAWTGVTWTPGQVQPVEPTAAAKLLAHTQVWVRADGEVAATDAAQAVLQTATATVTKGKQREKVSE